MLDDYALIPDLDWLAATGDADDSWIGPEPMLVNLQSWMDHLAVRGQHYLVAATYAAAGTALQHWDNWFAKSPDNAKAATFDEALLPPEQLAAVQRWLSSPTAEHRKQARDTVDLTAQLHWFHNEYRDVWFNQPGMWAIESAEHCVLSLTGDPYSKLTVVDEATIAVACAINSFRTSVQDDVREPVRLIVEAVADQLAGTG